MGLLDRIESEAMDGDVVKALQLCVKLGGHSGSSDLRDWASLELNGYELDSDVPDYRRINAPLCYDGSTLSERARGVELPISALPESAQEVASENPPLRMSISEIRDRAQSTETVKLSPEWGPELAAYMNQNGYSNGIYSIYWSASPAALNSIVVRVRTDLIRLVNEMRPGLEDGQDLPSSDTASQAVNVVINGDNNRVAMTGVEQTAQSSIPEKSPKRKRLEMAYWVAGVALAVVAIVTLVLRFA